MSSDVTAVAEVIIFIITAQILTSWSMDIEVCICELCFTFPERRQHNTFIFIERDGSFPLHPEH
jgi:hypothetical protein